MISFVLRLAPLRHMLLLRRLYIRYDERKAARDIRRLAFVTRDISLPLSRLF